MPGKGFTAFNKTEAIPNWKNNSIYLNQDFEEKPLLFGRLYFFSSMVDCRGPRFKNVRF